MESLARAPQELPAIVHKPEGEVGVLAEGARETLVEPTYLGQS